MDQQLQKKSKAPLPLEGLGEAFKTFFKIGMFTLGGGYAMIPLIEEEVVNRHRWIQSCPGVFAINISIFVGYKLNKVRGAVATALGTALPSFLIILAIAIFFHQFEDNRVIAAMFKGIRPAVVALIAVPTFNLAKRAQLNWFTIWIPVVSAWLLGVSPIWIIIAAGVGGYIYGKVNPSSVPEGTTNADKDDNSNKKAPSGAVGG